MFVVGFARITHEIIWMKSLHISCAEALPKMAWCSKALALCPAPGSLEPGVEVTLGALLQWLYFGLVP